LPAKPTSRSRRGENGFGEDILDKVQSAGSVGVAVPVIEAIVDLEGQGNLLVLGVDMTGDRSLREYDMEGGEDAVIEDPLIFLAQPDSLIVVAGVRRAQPPREEITGCRSGPLKARRRSSYAAS